jgi:hypothetical protein
MKSSSVALLPLIADHRRQCRKGEGNIGRSSWFYGQLDGRPLLTLYLYFSKSRNADNIYTIEGEISLGDGYCFDSLVYRSRADSLDFSPTSLPDYSSDRSCYGRGPGPRRYFDDVHSSRLLYRLL